MTTEMSIGYRRAAGAVRFVHHKTVTKSLRTPAWPRRAVVSLLAWKIPGKHRFRAVQGLRRRRQMIDVAGNCWANSLSGRTGKEIRLGGNKISRRGN